MGETDRLCFERSELFRSYRLIIMFCNFSNSSSLHKLISEGKPNSFIAVRCFVDMSGIIPEEEEEVQEVYDDVGPIDDDIYEELPGTTTYYIFFISIYRS